MFAFNIGISLWQVNVEFALILDFYYIIKSLHVLFFLVLFGQIMFGNMGVLDGISKGKCYVEMSTVDEETVQDVADVSQSTHCELHSV